MVYAIAVEDRSRGTCMASRTHSTHPHTLKEQILDLSTSYRITQLMAHTDKGTCTVGVLLRPAKWVWPGANVVGGPTLPACTAFASNWTTYYHNRQSGEGRQLWTIP